MITVTFQLDTATLNTSAPTVDVFVWRSADSIGNGTMTLAQFRNMLPAAIRTVVRTAIDAERTTLAAAAATAQARVDANADVADVTRATTVSTTIDAFTA